MPIPPRVTTLAMISATVVTAVGLNLTVMQRTADSGGAVTASAGAASTAGDPATAPVAPVDAALAPAAEVPTGSPDGAGNGAALDVAARFALEPSVADPASAASAALDPLSTGSPTSAPASSAPSIGAPATVEPSTPASAVPTPSSPPASASSTPARPASTPATAPPSVAATQPATTAPPTTRSGSSAAPPSTEYVTIEFDGVADVVIAFHDRSTVEFWAAWPEPGWTYMVEDDSPRGVKIKFRPSGDGDEAELSIRPDGGELRVKKEY